MDDKKIVSYIIYSIGEIVLVVIGILIALQINTWNENRIDNEEKELIVQNIHDEFTKNKLLTLDQIDFMSKNKKSSTKIINMMGMSNRELSHFNIDSIIYWALEYRPFTPSNNVLSEIIPTGKINLIKNQKLKDLLFEWEREVKNTNKTYGMFEGWKENHFVTYIVKHGSLKNIDKIGLLNWKKGSAFKISNNVLFQDPVFEDILDNDLFNLELLLNSYDVLVRISTDIIDETKR